MSLRSCALGMHEHRESRLVLTARGQFQSAYGSVRYTSDPRRALYRPAYVSHTDAYACETLCLSIALPGDVALHPNAFEVADEEFCSVAVRLSAEMDATDSAAELVADSLCAITAERLQCKRPERRRARWIARVRERLEDEYANPPRLATLAAGTNHDVTYMAATFRRTYGMTIGDYVRTLRLAHVRPLVEDSSVPLAEVAQRGGFSDQSHFTRLFRRRFGMTPDAYRQRAGSTIGQIRCQ